MNFWPELLKMNDGKAVDNPETFEKRRKEIIKILEDNIYGKIPEKPSYVKGVVNSSSNECSGSSELKKITISCGSEKGEFRFPFNLFLPHGNEKKPLIILINFRSDPFDKYYPAEEIIDNGFILASFCYNDVSSDNNDFTNGLASFYTRPEGNGYGKISLWAWAAQRVLDYMLTYDCVDSENVAVIGHSRLGKTALWTGANDIRFKYVISNDSGCAGAAYERLKHEGSETYEIIHNRFPFWFCRNFEKYVKDPDTAPFDQHFLIAASAPRFVCVASAEKDLWADPYSTQLCCIAASEAWELFGKKGYTGKEEPAVPGEHFTDGRIGYHIRSGIHYLGRHDWLAYMKYIKLKMNEKI